MPANVPRPPLLRIASVLSRIRGKAFELGKTSDAFAEYDAELARRKSPGNGRPPAGFA